MRLPPLQVPKDKMVCDKCEEKLSKLVVPDKWTDGARNTTGGKDGGRKIGGNKLLEKKSRSTSNRCARVWLYPYL